MGKHIYNVDLSVDGPPMMEVPAPEPRDDPAAKPLTKLDNSPV
jgi:hypothetical protein